MKSQVKFAEIYFNEQNTPMSKQFDDIYYSNESGLDEINHVFIEGNQLMTRFVTYPQSTFTLGETGFGSGLNFLVLWRFFDQFKAVHANHPLKTLHFISVEKYPLKPADLLLIHQQYPELAPYASKLQAIWPVALQPCQTFNLAPDITLTLYGLDVLDFAQHLMGLKRAIDAWFFDGFSPTKNPDMWSIALFTLLYQVTSPQGTFATFTAAGHVRRNLIASGYHVAKKSGFGKKREMLIGCKLD